MIVFCLTASPTWGQEPPRETTTDQRRPATEQLPAVAPLGPSLSGYPLELLGLFLPQQGPVTLTPSISVSEEFNDNVFMDNRNREWDFITQFSPALTLVINQPGYQLTAGYVASAQLYAREDDLSDAFGTQNFLFAGVYRNIPRLTLSASDSFQWNSNNGIVGGFSTQQESWTNTFSANLAWQISQLNSASVNASHSALRFQGDGPGLDSDTYEGRASFNHTLTPRLGGSLFYTFTYIDPQEQTASMTHTPMVGFTYQFTPMLIGYVNGGPAITQISGDTFVTPAGHVGLSLALRFGTLSAGYSRGVAVAGSFGGATDTQSISGLLTVNTLMRGLVISLVPAYTSSESIDDSQVGQVDVKAFTVSVGASYQISRFVSVFGGYTFLHQRTGSGSTEQVDVDQSRVRFGLQFGYPFVFN